MELIREHFRSIIFTTFGVDYHKSVLMNLPLLGDKAPSYSTEKLV